MNTIKARWWIERDHKELKQDFGLDHDDGRSWRGLHHHATLRIAAYGFPVAERSRGTHQKTCHDTHYLPYPKMSAYATHPSGAQRHFADSIATWRWMIAIATGAELFDRKQPHFRIR